MTLMRNARIVSALSFALGAIPALVTAQRVTGLVEEGKSHFDATGGPLSTRVVDAPFAADATTTVKMTTLEGRVRFERTGTARYYRDRAGRVRVEQMLATGTSEGPPGAAIFIVLDDPSQRGAIGLDPSTRVARLMPKLHGEAVGGGHTFGLALGPGPEECLRFIVFERPIHWAETRSGWVQEESLGNRKIEGVSTVGHRTTTTIWGEHAPVEIVDERWESPELNLLVYSRVSDPRQGEIEYRVTNIKRDEPSPTLFEIPADYEYNTRPTPLLYETWGNAPWR